MVNDPDLNYLKQFYYVVKHNGFTSAAKELHVQQPVVSRAIKLLEQQVGHHLIERQKKQIILTREGMQLYTYCQKLFAITEEIKHFVEDSHGLVSKEISFASTDSLTGNVLSVLFKNVQQVFCDTKIHHYVGNIQLFIDKLQRGELDYAIYFNVPSLPQDLNKSKLCIVDFCYVAKSSLSGDMAYLAATDIQVPAKEELPFYKRVLKKYPKAQIMISSNSSVVRRELALQGRGIALLPRFLVKNDLESKKLKTVLPSEQLPLFLIERKSYVRNKLQRELLSTLTKLVTHP